MKIGIIGVGKVGGSFLAACHEAAALEIVGIKVGRTPRANSSIWQAYGVKVHEAGAAVLLEADVVLLTVPDGQIENAAVELAGELQAKAQNQQLSAKVCLHCSGSLGLEPLAPLAELGIHCGSLHPLQSFAEARSVFSGIGMAVDGDPEAEQAARFLAASLQAQPFTVPASERRAYHAAACFCSNYLVTVTAIAQELLSRWTADKVSALQVLLPLIDGTVQNLHQVQQAGEALTGPIARGDADTVAGHLAVLPAALQQVYRELGRQTVPLAFANGSINEETAAHLLQLLQERRAKE